MAADLYIAMIKGELECDYIPRDTDDELSNPDEPPLENAALKITYVNRDGPGATGARAAANSAEYPAAPEPTRDITDIIMNMYNDIKSILAELEVIKKQLNKQ